MLAQVGHQFGVARGGNAMADAFRAEVAYRVPDGLRAGRLAGVRHTAQSGGRRRGEVTGVPFPGDPGFRAAQPEADQSVRALFERHVERHVGAGHRRLARDVEAPAQLDAVVADETQPGVLHRLAVRLGRDAAHDRGVRGQRQLRVPHGLGGKAGTDVVGECGHVLGVANQIHHRQVHLDEVREVGEGEVFGEERRVGGHRRASGVALGQAGHGLRCRRADVVDVQFHLGQAGDEIGQVRCHELIPHRSSAGGRGECSLRRGGALTTTDRPSVADEHPSQRLSTRPRTLTRDVDRPQTDAVSCSAELRSRDGWRRSCGRRLCPRCHEWGSTQRTGAHRTG